MRGFHLERRLAFIHHRETNSPKSLKGSKQLLPRKGAPPQRPIICTSGRALNAKLNTGSSIYSFKINIEIQSSRSSPGTQNWKTQALQVLVRSVLHELELQDVGVGYLIGNAVSSPENITTTKLVCIQAAKLPSCVPVPLTK